MATDISCVTARVGLGWRRLGTVMRLAAALVVLALVGVVFFAPRSVVADYMEAQSSTIVASARRHGLPPEVTIEIGRAHV